MRKKVLAMVLGAALAMSLFAGCGDAGGTSTEGTKGNAAETKAEKETTAKKEEGDVSKETEGTTPAQGSGGDFDEFPRPVKVDSDSDLKVGLLTRNVDGEFHQRVKRQVEIEAAHRGWDLTTIVYEVDTNFRDSFDQLMNQGVDAIIIGNTDTFEAKADMITEARQAGVGVYCIDNQVIPGVIVNTTMPNGVAAMEIVYQLGVDYNWDFTMAGIVEEGILVTRERGNPVVGFMENGTYPNAELVAKQDVASAPNGTAQCGYDFASAWNEQYGEDLDVIYSTSDYHSGVAAEALMKAGNSHTIITGFDGGAQAYAYIRQGTPFALTYSQKTELYAHACCEVLEQIQVQGLNPGDEGCDIKFAGESLYFKGTITTKDNCPGVGTSIHEAFDYYDPADTDAWYTWTDGPGIYMIEDYDMTQETDRITTE